MQLQRVLECLLQVGRTEAFSAISQTPDLCPNMAAVQVLDRQRYELVPFAASLSEPDRIAFIKSVAVLEHQVGGRGSVTHLKRLLPLANDIDQRLLDWILRNTKSYAYYSHGAHSIEEFELLNSQRAFRTSERVRNDQERQREDSERIAASATAKLYNAVRRGDIKAVRALIEKGANASGLAPDGKSICEFAQASGHAEIAAELRLAQSGEN
jgi:hypothetical protein